MKAATVPAVCIWWTAEFLRGESLFIAIFK
jgi:hypothetical protein